ncbi:MAG: Flp pilus assembly protein CpaB [Chloroflexi bacterium]|nr:MAG: Flp pilus assembly protein CpaB [Chloroflexota bacterium]
MRRTVYLAAFAILAVVAALLSLRAQHTVAVVVAAHDVRAGTMVGTDDLSVVRMHDDSVPAGSLSAPSDAVGRYAAWPLTAGEPVLARVLATDRSGGAVLAGLEVPAGYRAVAVPVQPAGAVGGMLARGDHVDVYATPLPGHSTPSSVAPSSPSPSGATTTVASGGAASADPPAAPAAVLIGSDVLVLQLRSDDGQALDTGAGDTVHGLNFGNGKLGSVVLAVPAGDVDRYASAVAEDSVYLALSVG